MSRSIWTQCGGSSNFRAFSGDGWRVVEAQHIVSTRKLVDSDEEQHLLESLIDGVKPPRPAGEAFAGLHYLLTTPFRHPPLSHGSRFGTRVERGIWYGALALSTAFAEVAYYRFVFLAGTKADLTPLTVELSAFKVAVRAQRFVDLTVGLFQAEESKVSSKVSYKFSQRLGRDMRAAGAQGFVYRSARDPAGGVNVGLFEPVFGAKRPKALQTFTCFASADRVEISMKDFFQRRSYVHARRTFEVAGNLPSPAL